MLLTSERYVTVTSGTLFGMNMKGRRGYVISEGGSGANAWVTVRMENGLVGAFPVKNIKDVKEK